MKNKGSKRSKQKASPVRNPKRPWWISGIVIGVATTGVILWQKNDASQDITSSTSTSTAVKVPANRDTDLLVGRWTRTDSEGAYVIEIKSAMANGKLDATYFNPNPIKVGHAEWQQKNGGLMVVVELRDVNYPGSTYTLDFLPSENRMIGNYYQATEGANFDVEFTRSR